MLWAARFRRASVIRFGLLGFALSLALSALTQAAWVFAIAWAAIYLMSGFACSTAEAALMDADPAQRERRMTEWTLAASLGDLATPLALAAVAALGFGYQSAWLAVAGCMALFGWFAGLRELPRARDRDHDAGDAEASTVRELLREAGKHPRLVAWLLGATLCSLMDETLVAFAALWIRQRFVAPSATTLALTSLALGAFAGLVLLRRLLMSWPRRPFLIGACAGAIASVALVLAASTLSGACAGLFLLGAFAATHYPLAQAAAYGALPGRSNSVAALTQLFAPVDLLLPLALGMVADRFGVASAIAALTLQPLALLVIANVRSRSPKPPGDALDP